MKLGMATSKLENIELLHKLNTREEGMVVQVYKWELVLCTCLLISQKIGPMDQTFYKRNS